MILIGYSGHAFVAYGILHTAGKKITGYCDVEEKEYNPFSLTYFGRETSETGLQALSQDGFFIAIGDNATRNKVYEMLKKKDLYPANAIHPAAIIDPSAAVAQSGVMIAANVTINPLAKIGTGVICNTGCIVEHECEVEDFVHIGPGAVLCGNVKIGNRTFVGANAVIRQGINIGKYVMIGAGAVVVKDVADNMTIVGVPAK
jgi:sugar O-acyltransferase (sialic acid O-acetyltransferase NeuD family)